MFGLKYVHGFFPNKSYPKLMKILDVNHKSTISNWISRESIPEEYLPILEREFKIGREYLNKHLTSEEMKYVQYLILKNQYEPEYEEAYFVEYGVGGHVVSSEKGVTETEYSKHEKEELVTQMYNKETIMNISAWLSGYDNWEVANARELLNSLIDFTEEDTAKLKLMTQILQATSNVAEKTGALDKVQDGEIPSDTFFDELKSFIKRHYEFKSEF